MDAISTGRGVEVPVKKWTLSVYIQIITDFIGRCWTLREMVPGAGIEPARRLKRGILSPLCLPIPPPGRGKRTCPPAQIHAVVYRQSNIVRTMEAEAGIEPAYTALQAAA